MFFKTYSGVAVSLTMSVALAAFPVQAQDYQVRAGDTLIDIARNQLGAAARWRDLCDLNRDQLEDCDRILAGMTIRLGQSQPVAVAPAPSVPVQQTAPSEPDVAANQLPNTSLRGAVTGPLGDGGQLPDDWFFFSAGGAQATLVVLDVTNDWIDVQISQTENAGIVFLGFTKRGSYVATTNDQVWTLAVDMAVLEDDGSGHWQVNLQGSQWAAQDASSSLGAFVFTANLPLGPELQPFVGSAVMTSPDVAFLQSDIRFVSSGPWTATYRIGVPVMVREQR
jgi:hypothetical protein